MFYLKRNVMKNPDIAGISPKKHDNSKNFVKFFPTNNFHAKKNLREQAAGLFFKMLPKLKKKIIIGMWTYICYCSSFYNIWIRFQDLYPYPESIRPGSVSRIWIRFQELDPFSGSVSVSRFYKTWIRIQNLDPIPGSGSVFRICICIQVLISGSLSRVYKIWIRIQGL